MTALGVLHPLPHNRVQKKAKKSKEKSFRDRVGSSIERSAVTRKDLEYGFNPYASAHAGKHSIQITIVDS